MNDNDMRVILLYRRGPACFVREITPDGTLHPEREVNSLPPGTPDLDRDQAVGMGQIVSAAGTKAHIGVFGAIEIQCVSDDGGAIDDYLREVAACRERGQEMYQHIARLAVEAAPKPKGPLH